MDESSFVSARPKPPLPGACYAVIRLEGRWRKRLSVRNTGFTYAWPAHRYGTFDSSGVDEEKLF
jgi:hypothetical protein